MARVSGRSIPSLSQIPLKRDASMVPAELSLQRSRYCREFIFGCFLLFWGFNFLMRMCPLNPAQRSSRGLLHCSCSQSPTLAPLGWDRVPVCLTGVCPRSCLAGCPHPCLAGSLHPKPHDPRGDSRVLVFCPVGSGRCNQTIAEPRWLNPVPNP